LRDRAIAVGAVNAFVAVAAGAFGAHGLKSQIPADRLAVWTTAAQYHLIHALALVLLGALTGKVADNRLEWTGRPFLAGIILFSGSLYFLALSAIGILGAITPFGGVCFLSGWAMLAVGGWKRPADSN